MMNDGFVDLRADRHSDGLSESFWPSFTDVMMVIVIIFIMASLVMLVKNWELVAELRATMQAEREAQMIVQSATTTNKTLSEQLTDTQYQLSLLRMQLMQAREKEQQKTRALIERERHLRAARNNIDTIEEQIAEQKRLSNQLNLQFIRSQQDYEAQSARLLQMVKNQASLQQRIDEQSDEIMSLQDTTRSSSQELSELQVNYDSLNVKYEKLVRPARSAKGKIVVEVRYEKQGGKSLIKYKKPGEKKYTAVSRKGLDNQLSRLKKENPGKLYIKIIIPSKSGLSYNEAWRFTSDILSQYDYYQD